ncbi:putative tRNA methyltransferase TRM10-type domain superfamily [Helianthus annuus]|nr:putative tRNA methyltransferase TRM10-type domain superfamily [Helianthus annuus]
MRRESKTLRLSEAKKSGQKVVLDLQFSELMAPNEIHSLVKQGLRMDLVETLEL